MIRRAGIFTLVTCLFLALLSPGLVQAQGELSILESSAEVEFPFTLQFSLSATSRVNITDVRLYYRVDRESFAQVTSEAYVEFVPDTAIDVQWDWDMRKTGGLPPGASLEYWWTIADISGERLATQPVRLWFEDNRYPWQSLTEYEVTIYWYEGEPGFAGEIMSAAQQALARLSDDTGAHLEKPVRIYIYAGTGDLQGAMIFPREWSGGVAYSRYGIIAIGVDPANLAWGKRAIAHELSHLVIHQMTLNPYSDLPTWLNEGLAMYAEGEPESGLGAYLGRATAEGMLFTVRSLASPFSAIGGQATLGYAQSYSLVEFLISEYGQGKMLELLTTFRQGNSYDGALLEVYGFDMDGLNTLWRDYIEQRYQEAAVPTTMLPVPMGY